MRPASVLVLAAMTLVGGAPGLVGAQSFSNVLDTSSVPPRATGLVYPRLDAGLNRVLASDDGIAEAALSGFDVTLEHIQVHIFTTPDSVEVLEGWLEGENAMRISSAGNIVQAHVDTATLRALATSPHVITVRKPIYYRPNPLEDVQQARAEAGSMITEALSAMNVPAWHSAGIRGAGVKVGVIDAGFTGYQGLLGTDLPSAGKVHVWPGGTAYMNNTEHGLMCAEIITDIAPAMDGLYLAAIGTEVDIVNATTWMRNNGVKVINMSLGWLSWGPGDGTGMLADNVNSFVSAGGFWANSAGNSRLAHWRGNYVNGGDGWQLFGQYNNQNWTVNPIMKPDRSDCQVIPEDIAINASLKWNQWTAPQTDLDFYIVKWNQAAQQWQILGKSEDLQNGQAGQQPVEEDFDVRVTNEATCYGFAIKHYSGPTSVQMNMFNRFDGNPLLFNVQENSITPPADAASSVSAAALNVSSFALKSYSSKGPTNGAGGGHTGGSIKPDLSGFADVSCHAYGAGECGGTSAAAPHIAGAAALAFSGNPSYSGTQVRSYLEASAIDMGSPGKDNDYGTGRLRLGTPPASSCTYSISPTSRSHTSSAATGTVSVSTQAGCSWTAVSNAGWISVTSGSSGSGSGSVGYSITANTSTSSRSGTITIGGKTFTVSQAGSGSPPPPGGSTWVEAVIHLDTGAGDRWRSDVGVLNAGTAAATINFRVYLDSGGTVEASSAQPVPAGGQALFIDLLGQLGRSDKGSLEVWAAQPIIVTSRTYNDIEPDLLCLQEGGTYGQFYDGYTSAQGLSAGQSAYIPQLRQDTHFRTNISVTNTGTGNASVTLRLYNASGAQVWSRDRTLGPGRFYQWVRPFQSAGQTNMLAGYARIEVNSGSGVLASGSVIDGRTGDPTTIPAKRAP